MIEEATPVAVLDCMVYLQAVVNAGGPAAALMRAVEEGRLFVFVSQDILDEIRDVLSRPKLRQKFPRLTEERAEQLVQFLRDTGILVTNVPPTFRYERDPKDEKYVNLVLVAHAPHLVSRDNDLLDLMDERKREGKEFRARFPTLTILDPVDYLRLLSRHP